MAAQLVPVFAGEINNQPVQFVDARLLHSFLKVVTRFNDWFPRRVEEYGFIDGEDFYSNLSKTKGRSKEDFISFTENPVKPQGGRPNKEYYLTLDMAKELSMVERNEKGRQARRYFIDCEKKLIEKTKQEAPKPTLDNLIPHDDNEIAMSLESLLYRSYKRIMVMAKMKFDKPAAFDYSFSTPAQSGVGIGLLNDAAQPQPLRFFCAYRTAFLFGGLGGAAVRLAGCVPGRPTPFGSPPIIGLIGGGFKPNYKGRNHE